MKKIILISVSFVIFFSAIAAKKKRAREYIAYIKGTYSYVDGIRKVGNVYELTIKTLTENVVIDSVWFGATPVPCDLLELKTKHRLDSAKHKGTYIVRANKNLYENYVQQMDSTKAYKNFKAPFKFNADAVIMYKVRGKRYYKSVKNIIKVKQKGYR